MSNRERYIEFCNTQPHLPLYFRPVWLDAVSDSWDALLAEDGGRIVGAMPYELTQRHHIQMIRQFRHTRYSAFYVAQPEQAKPYLRFSLNRKALSSLGEQLQSLPVDYVGITAPPMLSDWSPLYAQGFSEQTIYTFRIPFQKDFAAIWSAMHTRVRNKSKNRAKLVIKADAYGPEVLHSQIDGSFQKQGRHTGLTVDFIGRIYHALRAEGRASILTAEDDTGTIHGAACFVWDDDVLYYEFAGEDPALRSSNSLTLLVLEGIRMAHERGLTFDFDINMGGNFQEFAASFGAAAVPFCELSKITAKSGWKQLCLSAYLSSVRYPMKISNPIAQIRRRLYSNDTTLLLTTPPRWKIM